MYFQGIISLSGIFWVWDFFFSKCIWILKINLENEWHGSLKAKRTKQKVVFGMRHFTSMHTYLIQIKDQFLILFLKMKSSKQYWYTLKLSRIGCCVFFFFFRVWNVRYNHSHDQLILTGSSDSRVILSNMVSISSEPFGHMVDDDELSDQEDQHQEEKYEVSWVSCRC